MYFCSFYQFFFSKTNVNTLNYVNINSRGETQDFIEEQHLSCGAVQSFVDGTA